MGCFAELDLSRYCLMDCQGHLGFEAVTMCFARNVAKCSTACLETVVKCCGAGASRHGRSACPIQVYSPIAGVVP